MPRILTVCGSLRTKSFNRSLVAALPHIAPKGMTFTESPPIGDIPHYNADLQENHGIPVEVTDFGESVAGSDGVIFVSPEYNWTIPGALKNVLDWISRLEHQPFRNKPVAIQSVTGGQLGGSRMQYHMRMTLTYLNAAVFGTPEVFVGLAQTKFDPHTRELTDEATKKVVSQQLSAFADFIKHHNR